MNGQVQLSHEEPVTGSGRTERYMVGALLLVLLVLGGFVWWSLHRADKLRDEQALRAIAALREADSKLPAVWATELLAAYERDPNEAAARYAGKRFRSMGTAFNARAMSPDAVTGETPGFVEFTAGSGTEDDLGDRAVELFSADHWGAALASLKAGELSVAACTVDPLRKSLRTDSDGKRSHIEAFDCSSVATAFGTRPTTPFAKSSN